jgi:flagellar basal body-associated protein FliL
MGNNEIKKPSSKIKMILIILVIIIIIAVGIYIYWKYNTIRDTVESAQTALERNQLLEELATETKNEISRCEKLISQEIGEFEDFAYCKKFLEWTKPFNLNNNK